MSYKVRSPSAWCKLVVVKALMTGRITRNVDEPLLMPTVSSSYLLSLVGSEKIMGSYII
jgi:hypothetical protein